MAGTQSEDGVFDRLTPRRGATSERFKDRLRRRTAPDFYDKIADEEARVSQLAAWLRGSQRES